VRRSNEPLFWSLFSAGGMIAALLAPVLIIVIGFLVAANDVTFGRLHAIVTNPVGRVVLFAIASLTFFHWAHRFRHVLIDVGFRRFSLPLSAACYLAAVAGTVWAAAVAFT
jgi:succinate dehydrogenase subunit D